MKLQKTIKIKLGQLSKNKQNILDGVMKDLTKDFIDYFEKENDRLILNHNKGEQLPDSIFNRKQFLKKAGVEE